MGNIKELNDGMINIKDFDSNHWVYHNERF